MAYFGLQQQQQQQKNTSHFKLHNFSHKSKFEIFFFQLLIYFFYIFLFSDGLGGIMCGYNIK